MLPEMVTQNFEVVAYIQTVLLLKDLGVSCRSQDPGLPRPPVMGLLWGPGHFLLVTSCPLLPDPNSIPPLLPSWLLEGQPGCLTPSGSAGGEGMAADCVCGTVVGGCASEGGPASG